MSESLQIFSSIKLRGHGRPNLDLCGQDQNSINYCESKFFYVSLDIIQGVIYWKEILSHATFFRFLSLVLICFLVEYILLPAWLRFSTICPLENEELFGKNSSRAKAEGWRYDMSSSPSTIKYCMTLILSPFRTKTVRSLFVWLLS